MKQPQLHKGAMLAAIVASMVALSLIDGSVEAGVAAQDLDRVTQAQALAQLHAHTTLRTAAELFPTHR